MRMPRNGAVHCGGAASARPLVGTVVGMGRGVGFGRRVAVLLAAASIAGACSFGTTTNVAGGPSTTADPLDRLGVFVIEPPSTVPTTTLPQPEVEAPVTDFYDQERLLTFELTLPPENLAAIDADPAAEEYVEASLRVGDIEAPRVAVRYKGSIGAFAFCLEGDDVQNPTGERTCTKLSLKIDINRVDPELELLGLRKLQLHSMNLDPTHLRERLAYWMFDQAGVAAPRSTHARVVINGEYLGIYALVEQVDGRFTRRQFPDGTGNLYKEVWPFDNFGAVQDAPQLIEGLRTNEDEDPTAGIIQSFAQALLDAGGDRDAVEAVLRERADFDELISWMAVDLIIDNDDGPRHFYCDQGFCGNHNYYFYEDPTSLKVHVVPWDMDNAFENITQHRNPGIPIADDFGEVTADCAIFNLPPSELGQRSAVCDPFFAALALFRPEIDARIAELLAGPLAIDIVNAQLDAWVEQITPPIEEAIALHDDAVPLNVWRSEVIRLRGDLSTVYRG